MIDDHFRLLRVAKVLAMTREVPADTEVCPLQMGGLETRSYTNLEELSGKDLYFFPGPSNNSSRLLCNGLHKSPRARSIDIGPGL
jgi:hypothetical protein